MLNTSVSTTCFTSIQCYFTINVAIKQHHIFSKEARFIDIRERNPAKEVKVKEKGQHRAGKAIQRQLTAKGREALAQRPKGEVNEVEQADNTVEQTVTGSVSEVKGAARRGGQKVKAAHQRKRADIKERRTAQVPQEPGTEPPVAQEQPAIRERPQQAKQGKQAKARTEAKSQQPQAAPQGQPKELKRTAKERQLDIPRRPGDPKAAKPVPRTKATAPELRSETTPPKPEVYQGKMRQAAVQQRREQVIRQKGEKPPAWSMAKAAPARLDPTFPSGPFQPELNPPPSTGTPPVRPKPSHPSPTATARPTPSPTNKAAPAQSGGSRFAIREKVKTTAPKEEPPRGRVAIKTRQQVGQINGKSPAKPIKVAKQPGKKVAKAIQKQAQQQMKRHSQRKLVQQARKAAQNTAKTAGKAIVAAAKAVAAAISAIAGVVGGGVLLVALCVIFLVAAVVASPFGIFFAGQDPPPDATIPREVVAEVNAEYDAKIENLKAGSYDRIEMTGAPADWRDVLTVFAVKTAGSDDGVDVATLDADRIARLKAVYWNMTEIKTRVEVIEHSDGEGGSWTERVLYITVTGQTAEAAANTYGFTRDQHSQLVELQAPENNDLWLSLLYGISGDSGAGRNIVSVALSQIGNVGGQPYWSWYGFGSREEWCACFVSWCANECGYIDAGMIPKFASCGQGSQWFKSRGQWAEGTIEPVPGMIIFFDWDGEDGQDGAPDHVGVVERVENGVVYTVEGNSGDACRERHYTVGYYEIFGYGIPSY